MVLLLCILASIVVLIVSYILFKVAFGNMSIKYYMPHTHMFFYQLVAMCLMGSLLLVGGVRNSVLANFNITEVSAIKTIGVVWYSMLMISAFCCIFMKKTRKTMKNKVIYYSQAELICKDTAFIRLFWGIGTLITVFCLVYLWHYDAPIFSLIKGTIGRTLSARVSYSRDFEGSYFVKNILGGTVSILVSYVTFIYCCKVKKRYWRILFAVNFVGGICISGASLSKSGILAYLIVYIFLFVMMGKKMNMKKCIMIGVTAVLILLLAYYIQLRDVHMLFKNIFDFHSGPLGRILFMQISALPAYFMIFPSMHPFTGGRGVALLRFLGLSHIESGRVVAGFLEPQGVANGWVGTNNTFLAGDAYANFGWIGVAIAPVFVAFWISLFYRKMMFQQKEPIYLVCYVMILDNLVNGVTGGFCSVYLINTKVITISIFLLLYKIYRRIVIQKGYHEGVKEKSEEDIVCM